MNRLASYRDPAFYGLALALSLATWWRFRELPYDWDAASFIVDNARDLRATHFHPLVTPRADFAHPPLFVALLAIAWSAFGEERLVSHALEVPFFLAGIVGTYVLGRRLNGRMLGAVAAVLFAAVPVVQEEYAQVYVDLPLAGLLTAGLASWVTGRIARASLFFCLAAGIKVPSLIVPLALLAVVWMNPGERRSVGRHVSLAAPVAVVCVWLAYHRSVKGWLLSRPGRAVLPPRDIATAVHYVATVTREIFLGQGRWIPVLAGALAAAFVLLVQKREGRVFAGLLPLAVVLGLTILFFACMGEFGIRYAIFAMPPLLVASLLPLRLALRGDAAFGGAGLAVLAVFVAGWHPKGPLTSGYAFRPDADLGALDRITIGRRAAHYVRKHFPNAHVFGSYPESYQLTEPWQGYLEEAVPFTECADFEPEPGITQLIYVHGYSPGQRACAKLVERIGARGIVRFESNSKWLELWAAPSVPAPP